MFSTGEASSMDREIGMQPRQVLAKQVSPCPMASCDWPPSWYGPLTRLACSTSSPCRCGARLTARRRFYYVVVFVFFCLFACFVSALLSIFSWACDFFHCFSFRLSSQTKPDFLLGLGSSTVFVFFFVCVSPKLAALHRRRVSTVRGAVFFALDCWQQTLDVLVFFCGAVGMEEGLTCTFCPHTSRLGHVFAASAS